MNVFTRPWFIPRPRTRGLIAGLFRDMNDFGLRHADRIKALPDLPRRKRLKLERKILGQKIRVEL